MATYERVPEFCDSFRTVVTDGISLFIQSECRTCGGYGVVSHYRNNTPWDGRTLDGDCECCDGGVVRVETSDYELTEQVAA